MRRPLTFALALLVSGCSNAVQLSSGEAFVQARDATGVRPIDVDVAQVAAVEPNLHFPARIGIARIVNGGLSLPSGKEGELLSELGARHAALGEFVQVSPLVAAMVTGSSGEGQATNRRYGDTNAIVHDIRMAAARQHLDYVLIYEMGAQSRESDTVFALADVTLIGGALLPTRNIQVAGTGQAMFLDVRTGYPYGTAQAAVDLAGLGRSFGGDRREEQLRDKATDKVFAALIPEVEAMFGKLAAAQRVRK